MQICFVFFILMNGNRIMDLKSVSINIFKPNQAELMETFMKIVHNFQPFTFSMKNCQFQLLDEVFRLKLFISWKVSTKYRNCSAIIIKVCDLSFVLFLRIFLTLAQKVQLFNLVQSVAWKQLSGRVKLHCNVVHKYINRWWFG